MRWQEEAKVNTVGHSFAIAFGNRSGERGALIVETTGWERVELRDAPDPPLTDSDLALYRTLTKLMPHQTRVGLCGLMPPDVENRMYERVLLGHGCVYFTHLARSRYEYGARITDIRDPSFVSEWAHTAPAPTRAFTMRTREFLRQLCPDEAAVGVRIFPVVAGARAMLDAYDAMSAELPHMRRCLRPPPRSTDDFEALMCKNWAPLLPVQELSVSQKSEAGVYFTARGAVSNIKQALAPYALRIDTLPFMWSTIFHVSTHT
jgi:hypothetical protein